MRATVTDGCIMKSPVAVKGAARERAVQRFVPTVAEAEALSKAVSASSRWLALAKVAASMPVTCSASHTCKAPLSKRSRYGP